MRYFKITSYGDGLYDKQWMEESNVEIGDVYKVDKCRYDTDDGDICGVINSVNYVLFEENSYFWDKLGEEVFEESLGLSLPSDYSSSSDNKIALPQDIKVMFGDMIVVNLTSKEIVINGEVVEDAQDVVEGFREFFKIQGVI